MHTPEHEGPPIWAAFGDLMACLVGIFVLFFCWMVLMEVALTEDLESAREQEAEAVARADALERALAGPLASGLITLTDGRIGIRGAVLFDLGEADLSARGQRLLQELAPPLRSVLEARGEAVMVSGFTDDLALRQGGTFADNWELSAERALTVTRTLVAAGLPEPWIFAAGFGANHPVAENVDDSSRALNRRVEIAPVPRPLLERLTSSRAQSAEPARARSEEAPEALDVESARSDAEALEDELVEAAE